jgi:hypothetical protein
MKNATKKCMGLAITAMLAGFAVESQAQVTVFSDNYEGYTAGTSEFGWDSGNVSGVSVTIAQYQGVGGSQALSWDISFNSQYNGYVAAQMGYSGGNPSGNTDPNLNDYVLSFDMAIWNGVGLNHLQVDVQGWAGQWYSGAMTDSGAATVDTSSVVPLGGYQHISVNMGTLFAGSGGNFNPTSQTYQFQLQVNGWELANGGPQASEIVALDNLQVTMVPEPTTLALIGLGAAALLSFRRRQQ